MSWRSRVVWSAGMFLQPHHFQQEARYLERLVEAHSTSASPFTWGFAELQIDEGLLALGKLGLSRAAGLLPDGTPFLMPQFDPLPAPLDIPADINGELVCLALPMRREGVDEFGFDAPRERSALRYVADEESVRDSTDVAEEPATIQTGRLCTRLMRSKDTLDAYATVGVAVVLERRSDGMVVLDRAYIPPQVRIDATHQLSTSADLIHGLLRQRAEALAGRLGQLGQGVSELADFLMLQTLNRHLPVFAQHAATPVAHPRELHGDGLRLAGDLATLATQRRLATAFPPYRHDDLRATYAPLVDELRSMLSVVFDANAVQIPLQARKHGVQTATIQDRELLRTAGFVLAVNAQVPAEHLRQHFPAQTKLGPVDRIRDLVNLALPGITLRPLPVAPRQLPYHAGHYYFELERGGELWKQLEQTGNLALHVAGDFPGLELEFWAIRR